MHVKSITIVGGGTTGWLTAGALSQLTQGIDITLIESSEVPTIGVGESTTPHVGDFLNAIGTSFEDILTEVDGTIKSAIAFEGFYDKNVNWMYAFGPSRQNSSLCAAFDKLKNERVFSNSQWTDVFQQFSIASKNNRVPLEYDGNHKPAIQLDANKLANVFKQRFTKNVKHVIDTITVVEHDGKNIISIVGKDGTVYESDLFIDCTGFAALLINNLDTEFETFDEIPVDRAIVARTPYKDEGDRRDSMLPYTQCTAMSSGWRWRIPLWSRMGNGYVYSSNFISDEDAEKEFREAINWDGETKVIKFRNGIRSKSWVGNCVAIGLSSSFIEPLESTSLLIITQAIMQLTSILVTQQNTISSFAGEMFNGMQQRTVQGFRHWIYAHYRLTQRNDTPFWNWYYSGESDRVADMGEFDRHFLSRIRDVAHTDNNKMAGNFPGAAECTVAAGNNIALSRIDMKVQDEDRAKVLEMYQNNRKYSEEQCMDHYDYLTKYHY